MSLLACTDARPTAPSTPRPHSPALAAASASVSAASAEPLAAPARDNCSTPAWAAYAGITRYDEIAAGRTFSLRVELGPEGWVPAEPLGMPAHHASHLSFDPPIDEIVTRDRLVRGDGGAVDELWAYATAKGAPRVEKAPGKNQWRAEYVAHVDCLYVPNGSYGGGD